MDGCLTEGKRAGFGSVVGVALGNTLSAMAAAFGLAAATAASATAFHVVKYIGAAYLIYLGVQTLRGAEQPGPAAPAPLRTRCIVRDGMAVATRRCSSPRSCRSSSFMVALLPVLQKITAFTWVLAPVGLGAMLLIVIALLYNNLFAERHYPVFWW